MSLHHLVVTAPLLLALALPAQETVEKPEAQGPTPAEAQGPTPEQRLEQLQKEKARLQAEIGYAKKRVESASKLMIQKLDRTAPNYELIDAGTSATAVQPVAPKPIQRKHARVGTKEEMDYGGTTAMVMVEGRAISQAYFDGVINYLESYPTTGPKQLQQQRALYDLIRIEAVAAEFIENDGEVNLTENLASIENGSLAFDAAAQQFGTLQGAKPDGTTVVSRNSVYGPTLEQIAFNTPVGKMSRPFRTLQGYALLKVDSFEKGEKPELDKVHCHVVQFAYSDDAARLQAAQFKVNSGQVQVLVRDEGVLEMLPAVFKKPAARSAPAPDKVKMRIEQLQKRLAEIEGAEDKETERTKLRQMIENLQQQLPKQAKPDSEAVRKAAQRKGYKKASKDQGK